MQAAICYASQSPGTPPRSLGQSILKTSMMRPLIGHAHYWQPPQTNCCLCAAPKTAISGHVFCRLLRHTAKLKGLIHAPPRVPGCISRLTRVAFRASAERRKASRVPIHQRMLNLTASVRQGLWTTCGFWGRVSIPVRAQHHSQHLIFPWNASQGRRSQAGPLPQQVALQRSAPSKALCYTSCRVSLLWEPQSCGRRLPFWQAGLDLARGLFHACHARRLLLKWPHHTVKMKTGMNRLMKISGSNCATFPSPYVVPCNIPSRTQTTG